MMTVHQDANLQLGVMESRFAELIWQNAPIPSGELIKICEAEFGWKKSTTYTMLRRLCEKGLFINHNGQVSAQMSQQDFQQAKSQQFVQENFNGSLPRFLVAFGGQKGLSQQEITELEHLIDSYKAKGE